MLFKSDNIAKRQCADVQAYPLDKNTIEMQNAPNNTLASALKQQHPMEPIIWEQTQHEKDTYYCKSNIITTNIVGCANNWYGASQCGAQSNADNLI